MPQPPDTPLIARELVRFIPFASQRTVVNVALAAAGTIVAEFDAAAGITDANQLLAGAFPGAANPQRVVGPNLDAGAFSVTTAGTMLVEFAIDRGCAYRTVTTAIVAIGAFSNISGLRITARFVRVTYTNTGGVASLVEFGVFIRST